MTKEELKKLEETVTWDVRHCSGRNSMEEIAEGLLIINKYAERPQFSAEHDIVYAGDPGVLEKMSEEDCRMMLELGWHWSKDVDVWASHV